jgi:hypothetical protein
MVTRNAFINNVITDLTEGLVIPSAPNLKRINNVIDNARRYFYENDDNAVEFEYTVVRSSVFNEPLFKDKRKIIMPECVNAVTEVREFGGQYGFMNINPDFRKTNYNYILALTGSADDMLTAVTNGFYQDHLRNFIIRSVAYEYNPYTKMLTITGRDVPQNLLLETYLHIPEEGLFNMDAFFKYVCGKCKVSISNIYNFADINLIGGNKIQVQNIKDEGNALLTEVQKYIDDQKGSVDFMQDF